MRQTIVGLIAAAAVTSAGAAPAMACGFDGCSPCATGYVNPCAPAYVAPPVTYGGCGIGCGYAYERLVEPTTQYYYYVNQGPTYTGPGAFAPYPTYRENAVVMPYSYGYGAPAAYGYRWHRPWHVRSYRYGYSGYRHLPRVSYAPQVYAPRYGYHRYAPHHHGPRLLRRYY